MADLPKELEALVGAADAEIRRREKQSRLVRLEPFGARAALSVVSPLLAEKDAEIARLKRVDKDMLLRELDRRTAMYHDLRASHQVFCRRFAAEEIALNNQVARAETAEARVKELEARITELEDRT